MVGGGIPAWTVGFILTEATTAGISITGTIEAGATKGGIVATGVTRAVVENKTFHQLQDNT